MLRRTIDWISRKSLNGILYTEYHIHKCFDTNLIGSGEGKIGAAL